MRVVPSVLDCWEDRPVQYNSKRKTVGRRWRHFFGPFQRKCGHGRARQRVREQGGSDNDVGITRININQIEISLQEIGLSVTKFISDRKVCH